MPASPAQVEANRKNAALSTGPRTPEGKAASRANAYKHGLTGSGVVLADDDAAEVDRLTDAFRVEMGPPGEAGEVLIRRMAVLAVRMDHCVEQESAALSQRVRAALDEFEAPEGTTPEQAERLRTEAGRVAMFDPSKEAAQARRYEAAAERGFFKAIKELRQLKREATAEAVADPAAESRKSMAQMGSFSPAQAKAPGQASTAAAPPVSPPARPQPVPSRAPSMTSDSLYFSHFDVPIAIGRAR